MIFKCIIKQASINYTSIGAESTIGRCRIDQVPIELGAEMTIFGAEVIWIPTCMFRREFFFYITVWLLPCISCKKVYFWKKNL